MGLEKKIKYLFGAIAFIATFIVYALTVQPSVPLWDCGEFTAATTWQQVPHPPGAPLFLMMGKVFQILLPFGPPGWSVNMVSVFATSFFVLLLYLTIIKVIINFRGKELNSVSEILGVYGSALVGALAFAYCDTVWFNGVESEVYATSQLFTSLVVYLMMIWNEKADLPGNEKYLLLIFYLIGLSIGVHLLAILTIFSLFLLVYFRKYELNVRSFMIMGVLAIVSFFIIYKVILMWIPGLLAGHSPFKNEAREYTIENNAIMVLIGLILIFGGVAYFIWATKKKKPLHQLVLASYLLIFLGFTTYCHILIRANANPPMNENEPKNFYRLVAYLGREQYGEQVLWPRRTDYNDELKMYYYNLKDENGNYVYGEWNPPGSKEVMRKDGTIISVPSWDNVNVAGELAYMWKYQIDHMYLRYFFWNFVGRESDVQDAQEAWFSEGGSKVMNFKNGYADKFPVRFFALPLIFGLVGLYYHFKRDPKMALVFLAMFLLMGVLAAIAQNQQNPQPRERDYFYTGSFMVWCLWIGVGTYFFVELLNQKTKSTLATAGVIVASLILVPLNMLRGGWDIHTRARNYFPFDYAYNILQSLEKDAIVFTNGDNDTFPVWFLQDVAGVRRDVRVVNLSLGQTLWYIDQLKNREPWGAKKIPLSFTDEQLHTEEDDPKALSYEFGEAKNIRIPVKKEILAQYTNDTSLINKGYMEFTFVGKQYTERNGKPIYIFFVNNKLILDILQQTKFERPVYFSTTCGSDVFSGLGKFLRLEGMAWRICPVPQTALKTGQAEPTIMDKCLLNIDNSDNFHKEPHYGFKLRYLSGNGPYVYYDEVHRRMINSYRQIYMNYAAYLIDKGQKQKAAAVLDTLNKYVSPKLFQLYYDEEYQMSILYKDAGDTAKAKLWANAAIKTCKEMINDPRLRRLRYDDIREEIRGRNGPYKVAAAAYAILGDYSSARDMLRKLYDLVYTAVQSGQTANWGLDENAIQNNLYDILGNVLYIDQQEVSELIKANKKQEASKLVDSLIANYKQGNDQLMKSFAATAETRLRALISGEKEIDTLNQ
jgi:hypothetical protein